jgi:hypothetical protein
VNFGLHNYSFKLFSNFPESIGVQERLQHLWFP